MFVAIIQKLMLLLTQKPLDVRDGFYRGAENCSSLSARFRLAPEEAGTTNRHIYRLQTLLNFASVPHTTSIEVMLC